MPPAGAQSWGAVGSGGNLLDPTVPCSDNCLSTFTIKTSGPPACAFDGYLSSAECFLSLEHNPALAAMASTLSLETDVEYSGPCADGSPNATHPSQIICTGVGTDRFGWWHQTCIEAMGCSDCAACFFPDGYPSVCMEDRAGQNYTVFQQQELVDFLTDDGYNSWWVPTGPCDEPCAADPAETVTIWIRDCPEESKPYLCLGTNPYLNALVEALGEGNIDPQSYVDLMPILDGLNTNIKSLGIDGCTDSAGTICGWNPVSNDTLPNLDHYGWVDPLCVEAVKCGACQECFLGEDGYPVTGMLPADLGMPRSWSPGGYEEWCSDFSLIDSRKCGTSFGSRPDVEFLGGRRLNDQQASKLAAKKAGAKVAALSAAFGKAKSGPKE